MQSNFPTAKLFSASVFFILSLSLFLFFFRAMNHNNTESQTREEEWRIETQRRDEISALDHSVKIIEGERADLETHFAKSSDVVPFFDTIEGLAVKVGSKAEVTSVDILADHAGLSVGLKASGSFSSLYKFLTLLENSPYELDFSRMDLTSDLGTSVGGKVSTVSKWDVVFKLTLLSFTE